MCYAEKGWSLRKLRKKEENNGSHYANLQNSVDNSTIKKVRISTEVYSPLRWAGLDHLLLLIWDETLLLRCLWALHTKINGNETRKQKAAPKTQLLKEVSTCVGGSVYWLCQVLPSITSQHLKGRRLDWDVLFSSQDSRGLQYLIRRKSEEWVPDLHDPHKVSSCSGKLVKINSLAVIDSFMHFVNFYERYFKCTFILLNYAEMFHPCLFYEFFSLPFGNNILVP